MKYLLIAVLALFHFQALANVDNVDQVERYCPEPADLHPQALAYKDRYLSGEMLNTAFLRGWMWFEPGEEAHAICVICEFGKPNDPDWGSDLNVCDRYQRDPSL